MYKLIAAACGAATLVAALSSIAVAAPAAPGLSAVAGGTDDRQVTITRVVPTQAAPRDESGIDRTFHPDYARALTVEQTNAAWNAEIDRVMETPIGLGGG
jgi:hypothetical protein